MKRSVLGFKVLYSPVVQGVGTAPADGASAVLVQVGLGAGAVLVRLAASSGGSGRGGRVGGCGGVGSVLVEHPPAGLARALVLHPHELAVQRQVVSDGVLKKGKKISSHCSLRCKVGVRFHILYLVHFKRLFSRPTSFSQKFIFRDVHCQRDA